jgi:DNA topoisomerase-1
MANILSYDEKHLMEGIGRRKKGNQFIYFYIDNGKLITDEEIERINKLKIPPAWTNLWISRDPNSSIQAIGKDINGKKQYRYHNVHIEKAEKEKFERLLRFIHNFPKLEKKIKQHDELQFYNKDKVISLMLQLVNEYHMRVGKEVYARTNKSYGISSMRKKHVKIHPSVIYLKFKGKSNKRLHFTINDGHFINSLKILMKLEGDKLFQYITINENGKERIVPVSDRDLNKYIQEHMGDEFTIKDFRTFGANLYFIKALMTQTERRTPKNRKTIKQNLVHAINTAANHLKHTGTVSKKSYVMSFAIELYQNNPQFFIENKKTETVTMLIKILEMYKKTILE